MSSESFLLFVLFYMYECFVCMPLCTICVLGAQGSQKRVRDLEVELQMFVNYHVGTRN